MFFVNKAIVCVCLLFSFFEARTQTNAIQYGTLTTIDSFASKFVLPRRVDVWLPDGYDRNTNQKYSVLYMQDGQNLFIPSLTYGGAAWEADSILGFLQANKKMPKCIVVAIWNTPKRFVEYLPATPYNYLPEGFKKRLMQERPGQPVSDEYLRFIVEELKPYIDSNFATLTGRENTFIAGASMGGLISMYALLEYPTVFGGAACFSTHWPLSLKEFEQETAVAFTRYIDEKLPKVPVCKLYFDFGTETLDSRYEPYQNRIDSVLMAKGYTEKNWITRKFEGAAHNEISWQKRLHIPLFFLFETKE